MRDIQKQQQQFKDRGGRGGGEAWFLVLLKVLACRQKTRTKASQRRTPMIITRPPVNHPGYNEEKKTEML